MVNSHWHNRVQPANSHNAEMHRDAKPKKEPTAVALAIAQLCEERRMTEVFKKDGTVNGRQLAARLRVQQSTLHRIMSGDLTGKEETITPIATGFGLSYIEFIARIRPSANLKPVQPLPPDAVALWEQWQQLPKGVRDYLMEQIKSTLEIVRRFPELSAVVNQQAEQAATLARIARTKKRA
jgi:transcriptional regulator with XRE-family HTH domain